MSIKKKLLGSVVLIGMALLLVISMTFRSFAKLTGGFALIVDTSEQAAANSETTKAAVSETSTELDAVAARIPLVAESINGTNMRVKILDRKIQGISETLDELATTIEETCETLPEGDARDELEWLSDDVGDLQETMKREALVGLKDATRSMEECSTAIAAEVAPLVAATEHLDEVAGLSDGVLASSRGVQSFARALSGHIRVSRNTLGAILAGIAVLITLLSLAFARFLARSLAAANDIAVGITAGNLNQDIATTRKDEIGQLLASMHGMQKSMRESLEAIESARTQDRENTAALEMASEQQRQQAEELRLAAEAQKKAAARDKKLAEAEAQAAEDLRQKVEKLLDSVEDAANGDLTREIEVLGEDAIGQVGSGLERLLDELRQSITSIARSSETLSHSSSGMIEVSAIMNGHAVETADEAHSVALAAEKVSANIQTVATATEQMNASIREISAAAGSGADVAAEAVEKAAATSSTMSKLDQSTTQISDIVKVITSIAEQTNLLALNATIEAARAGEAGKGFAVVASEVKNLASETAEATEEIARQVGEVQSSSRQAVAAIGEIGEIIDMISDIQAGIASAVEEQTATTGEISRNIADASHGSQEIASGATSMADAAKETLGGAETTRTSANELATMAAELTALVGKFRY
jgi:methyl-accepting chemotaxis protein